MKTKIKTCLVTQDQRICHQEALKRLSGRKRLPDAADIHQNMKYTEEGKSVTLNEY